MTTNARTLFQLIESEAKDKAAVQHTVIKLFETNNFDEFSKTAGLIENKYGDKKEEKNNRLSILRMQMRRACRILEIKSYTVKKSKGEWTVVETVAREKDETTALEKALQLVLDNLTDDAVYKTITAAIAAMATQVPDMPVIDKAKSNNHAPMRKAA